MPIGYGGVSSAACVEFGCDACLDELDCGHGPMCEPCAEEALECPGCFHRQCNYCKLKRFRGNCDCIGYSYCDSGGNSDDSDN